jgi:NAD(P)-dependent dehydrogenase (short-subunit alcohol dehydrogenase family)
LLDDFDEQAEGSTAGSALDRTVVGCIAELEQDGFREASGMFDGKTILVTGAAGSLGTATVRAFSERRARLVLVGRDCGSLEAAFPELAGDSRHLLLAGDVTSETAMSAVATRAIAHTGRVHAVIHIAGGFAMGEPVHAMPRATWDAMMDVNAWSFVTVARAFVPHMQAAGGGRIVAVSARAAERGQARMGAYCAAKSALQRLVEALSAEVRDQGINVNSVAPSIIDTPPNRASMPKADFARWVAPGTLAQSIVYLASDAAAAIHGHHLVAAGRV